MVKIPVRLVRIHAAQEQEQEQEQEVEVGISGVGVGKVEADMVVDGIRTRKNYTGTVTRIWI
jgi:hypothetical protein